MTRAVPIVRNILWAEGAFFCLGVPQIVLHLAERSGSYRWDDSHFLTLAAIIYACLAFVFVTGVSALVAAYGLENNRKWAIGALRVTSILNLAVVPFGTALGAGGLWMTTNARARAELANEVLLRDAGGSAKPKRLGSSRSWAGRLAMLAQLVASAAAMPWMGHQLESRGVALPGYPGFLMCGIGAVLIGIVFHELGHVAAGKLVGLRFRTVSAGPLVASSLSQGWRVQWVNSMGLWNGMTVMSPGKPARLRTKAIVFMLGGPLGSIGSGVLGLRLMTIAAQRHWGICAVLLGILGVTGILNGFANLLPFRTAAGFTDGARLVQLWRRQPEGIRLLSELAFGLSDTTTLRPRDWHADWISAVTHDETSPGFSRGCYRAYVYHLDRGEIDDAGVWLARCIDSHRALRRDPYRSILAMENAFYEARHLKNAGAAKEWFSVPRVGIPAERFTVLRVKAAIHIADGERELAAQVIRKAVRLHAMSAGTGCQQFERAVLRDVQNWLDELTGEGSLSRLAQAVRDRDSLIEVANVLDRQPGESKIRRLLRHEK